MFRSNRSIFGALSWLLFAAANAAADAGPPPIQVAVSVPPQAFFVARIGGPLVRVETLLPAGTAPATYAPTPRQMVALNRARLYVLVGHPDFVFETKHVRPLLRNLPEISVVDMSRGMDLLPAPPDPAGHHGAGDPHVWLAPTTVRVAARNITAALARIDPAHADRYRANLRDFLAEISRLDAQIRAALDGLTGRAFMVYHPAWGYFAHEYGLEQVAIEAEGKDPSPSRLLALVREARRRGVRAIFVQRGFSAKSARIIAAEIGASVREVDPLAEDWPANLRQVAAAFHEALARERGLP